MSDVLVMSLLNVALFGGLWSVGKLYELMWWQKILRLSEK